MVRKLLLGTTIFFSIALGVVTAQTVIDVADFSDLGGWTPAAGEWEVDGNRLYQRSTTALMARIDRELPHEGEYELRFNVRYEDGGYRTEEDLRNEIFHAGFGVHVGLSDSLPGVESWGAGQGYLLWLNLDTRERTMENYPQHFGFRAQVYESEGPISMDLMSAPWVEREFGNSTLSIDIVQALAAAGIRFDVADVEPHLNTQIPMRIRVNTNTGTVSIADPTAPLWYRVPLDPDVLSQGEHIAFRTNSLAVSFGNFRVVEQ